MNAQSRTIVMLLVIGTFGLNTDAHGDDGPGFEFDGTVWHSTLSGFGDITIEISGTTFNGKANDPDLISYSSFRCSGDFNREEQMLDGYCRAHGYAGYDFPIKGKLGRAFRSGRYRLDFYNDEYSLAFPAFVPPEPPRTEPSQQESAEPMTPVPVETMAADSAASTEQPTIEKRLAFVKRLFEQGLISASEAARTRTSILNDL